MNQIPLARARRLRNLHTIAWLSPAVIVAAGFVAKSLWPEKARDDRFVLLGFAWFALVCISFLWAPIVRRYIFSTVNPDGHLRSDAITFSLLQFPFGGVMMVNELLDAATGGKLRKSARA